MRHRMIGNRCVGSLVLALVLSVLVIPQAAASQNGEWPAYGADKAGSKYSPLDQINKDTVHDLQIVWRQSTIPDAVRQGSTIRPSTQSQNTPLMVDGLLYVSTGLGTVAALDPASGEVVWYDAAPEEGQRRGGSSRGVAYWKSEDGNDARIIAVLGSSLVALNAQTGARYPDFGEGGEVDLLQGFDDPREVTSFGWRSAPLVIRGVVIIGSFMTDVVTAMQPAMKEMPPGDVRGFDVRTGEQLWIFHVIPKPGEFGNDTWLTNTNEDRPSWEYTGNTNMWAWPSGDEELGYVYLPLSTPTGDYYGGQRPGNNLFAESIVCLDARTGERVWHFQVVHHGIWDYDFPAAPNLVDITVDGREIKAIAQTSKQAFIYVLDRVTGEPVWPIEERPVPQGDVPGEWYSPTQPFPTKPAPFDLQGVTEDDLIDFTPELRAEALRIVAENARFGPIFEPPALRGTRKPVIQAPGTGGGINWPGSAVDPETGRIFIPSQTRLRTVELVPYESPATVGYFTDPWANPIPGPQGLPIVKPPYKRITAIDLNTGDHLWVSAHGDGPRNHPALRDLDLPALGGGSGMHGGGPLVTKTLLIVNSGGRDMADAEAVGRSMTAYDKDTGEYLGSVELPAVPQGNPITYMHEGKQYILVAIGGRRSSPPELIALALR